MFADKSRIYSDEKKWGGGHREVWKLIIETQASFKIYNKNVFYYLCEILLRAYMMQIFKFAHIV